MCNHETHYRRTNFVSSAEINLKASFTLYLTFNEDNVILPDEYHQVDVVENCEIVENYQFDSYFKYNYVLKRIPDHGLPLEKGEQYNGVICRVICNYKEILSKIKSQFQSGLLSHLRFSQFMM